MSEGGWLVIGNLGVLAILATICMDEHTPWPLLSILLIHFRKTKPDSEQKGASESNDQTNK